MSETKCNSDEERMENLKAFDNTKLGVRGLVDAGIAKLPKMFIKPRPEEEEEYVIAQKSDNIRVPIIDFRGGREKVVRKLREACENWGIFQVVNHGIPTEVSDKMIEGVREFNEGDIEAKKAFYSRESNKSVTFNSNYDLYLTETVNWRDALSISMAGTNRVDPDDLPPCCRDATMEYIKQVIDFGNELLDLLSEGLGLETGHLRSMDCNEGKLLVCNYYPECPEPDLAIGVTKHTDSSFITMLAQDQVGGLQALYQNKYWVNVEPLPGAFVVNVGDYLQLVSNDIYQSSMHRVIPSHKSRISVAFFFSGHVTQPDREYGPIKELTSLENPPKYTPVKVTDHIAKFYSVGLHQKPGLEDYKL